MDPLLNFFNELFTTSNLTNISLAVMGLTWLNKRCGDEGIAKSLDRFLCSVDFLSSFQNYRSWVVKHFISDQCHVLFQLEMNSEARCYPFKFNPV